MQNLSSLSDNELIDEVKNGNIDAFQTLVFRHDKNVLSIAARYAHNAEDAKDIYQEVFIRVHKGINKFKKQSEFKTWLYRIATNVCISFHRNRKKYIALNQEYEMNGNQHLNIKDHKSDSDGSPHKQMMSAEISDRVSNAVNLLSPQQKLVFILRHYEGYKLSEIATFMRCTEGTVKKQLFTAIRKLREDLKDFYLEGVLA
jgi:RNA polymerase sigma-70 factor (ECF subfamily)